jgi:hypothetical protein
LARRVARRGSGAAERSGAAAMRLRALLLIACALGVAGGGPPLSLPLQRRRHPGGALHPARRALLTVEASAQLPLDANAWGQGRVPDARAPQLHMRARAAARNAAGVAGVGCAARAETPKPRTRLTPSPSFVTATCRGAQRVHHHHHARHAAAAVQCGGGHRLCAAVGRLRRLRLRL